MGGLISSRLACCTGQMMFGFLCGSRFQGQTVLSARLTYVFFAILYYIVGIIAFWNGPKMMKNFEQFGLVDCNDDSYCMGIMTVYRLSFTVFIVHSILLLGSLSGGQFSQVMEEDCWHLKIFMYVAITLVTFFIPNDFFVGYSFVGIICSWIFYIIMAIYIIDIAYRWNESWLQKYIVSSSQQFWYGMLITSSIILITTSITITVLNFVWFTGQDCALQIITTILTSLSTIFLTLFSISNYVSNGSLLTSSAISCYITYLNWAALSLDLNEECNQLNTSTSQKIVSSFDCVIIAIVLIYYTSRNTSYKRLQEQDTELRTFQEINQDELVEQEEKDRTGIYFHCLMAIFAAALCGLCSQWESEEKTILPQVIKLIQETMIVALYFWTLIAPTCCPERDFDY